MHRVPATWPRRHHGKVQRLSENLWLVRGPVPGMLIQRQMVIARDESGRLLLHSALALNPFGMAELEAFGTPTWLVVPNGYHRLDAPAYKKRYPGITVVAPRGSVDRVSEAVTVDLTYDEFPASAAIKLESAPWLGAQEGVVHVRSSDGATLVFNDLLWTLPHGSWSRAFYRCLRQGPQVPFLAKRMFVSDARALRAWLLRLARTEQLIRLVPGHGAPIHSKASDVLLRVAASV